MCLLGDLDLPSTIDRYSIYGNAFSGNSTLTSITASSAVTGIGAWAFHDCANLVYADLSTGTMTQVDIYLFIFGRHLP